MKCSKHASVGGSHGSEARIEGKTGKGVRER
jgi:hypothetical protein